MTIVFDAVSSAVSNNESSETWAHTIGAGNNRILFVFMGGYYYTGSAFAPSIVSITFNGDSLTRITNKDVASLYGAELWYMVAPDTGTHNIVITYTGTHYGLCGAASYTGVYHVSPYGTVKTNGSTSTTDISVTALDSGFIFSCLFTAPDDYDVTPAAGQNVRLESYNATESRGILICDEALDTVAGYTTASSIYASLIATTLKPAIAVLGSPCITNCMSL